MASTSTVGSSSIPVWLNAGVLTACGNVAAFAASNISRYGYVRFTNGLLIQWGETVINTTTNFPVSYSIIPELYTNVLVANSTTTTALIIGASRSETSYTLTSTATSTTQVCSWLAVGVA